jgi:hypothetical protein
MFPIYRPKRDSIKFLHLYKEMISSNIEISPMKNDFFEVQIVILFEQQVIRSTKNRLSRNYSPIFERNFWI